MKHFIGATIVTALLLGIGSPARADDKDAMATVDKAIKAMGGEEKLGKAKAISWNVKGKMTLGGNDSDIEAKITANGLDQYHQEFDGDFGGNKFHGVFVLSGDKGWRKIGDMGGPLDKDGLAMQKRAVYLQVVPTTLVPLKTKDFKIETVKEEKVGDKPAAGIKVTAPDGKDFTLFFDKETGLPVKLVAKVPDFQGGEVVQETTFSAYKEIDGIKKATKVENKRGGEKFQDLEVKEFKILDKVDPKEFEEPK